MTIFETLMRPIEVDYGSVHATTTNPTFQMHKAGSYGKSLYVEDGVWGSVYSLLSDINAAIAAEGVSERFYLNTLSSDSTKLGLAITPNQPSVNIRFYDKKLARILGVPELYGDWSAAISVPYAATYAPTHTFFSPYQLSSHDRWWSINRYKGVKSSTGNISGFILGPQLYERTFSWSANLYTYRDQETATYTQDSVTYYPNSERSWEEFVRGIMEASPTTDAASGCPMTGFYFINSGEVMRGSSPTITDITGNGGIRYELSSSPDYYTFCAPVIKDVKSPQNFLPVGRQFHNIELDVTTATAPTWAVGTVTYDDSPA